MTSDVFDGKTFLWVCVKNLLDEISTCFADHARYKIVTAQDLLVQLASIWIFKRKVTASHGIQDDTC